MMSCKITSEASLCRASTISSVKDLHSGAVLPQSVKQLKIGQCSLKPFLGTSIQNYRSLCLQRAGNGKPTRTYAVRASDGSGDLLDSSQLPFWERMQKAWKILFPPPPPKQSYAEIARDRLRLVLYSDRGEVSSEVRRKLRQNIIEAISSYVDVEDEDEIQLSVAAEPTLGAVYSVTIPVRRVKPEYQESWSDTGFRDRFYEEILRERGVDPSFNRLRIETKMLDPEDS